MNTSKIFLQKSCLFTLAASSLLLADIPAHAINLSFDASQFSITQGIGNNSTPITSDINVKSPPDGFGDGTNGFFLEEFLLLGARPSDTSIPTDSLVDNNSTAESPSFSVDSEDITKGIKLKFTWAFRGNATGDTADKDNFNILLVNVDTLDTFDVFTRDLADPGNGYGSSYTQVATADTTGMTAGNYKVSIELNENTNLNSSAAGYDDFEITNVPFEFSPSQGLLLIGGFWGLSFFMKRRKQLANCGKDFFN